MRQKRRKVVMPRTGSGPYYNHARPGPGPVTGVAATALRPVKILQVGVNTHTWAGEGPGSISYLVLSYHV